MMYMSKTFHATMVDSNILLMKLRRRKVHLKTNRHIMFQKHLNLILRPLERKNTKSFLKLLFLHFIEIISFL